MGGWVSAIGASAVGYGECELFAVGTNNTLWRAALFRDRSRSLAERGRCRQRHPDGRVELVVIGTNGDPVLADGGRLVHDRQLNQPEQADDRVPDPKSRVG